MRLRLTIVSAALALALVPGCKRTYDVETSAPAAAGLGKLTLAKDKTGNGSLELSIDHLAAPGDIDPSFQAYVVWVQIEGKDAHKLGILDYKPKKRAGSLDATYSADQFTVIVSLEKDPKTDVLGGTVVYQQAVQAPKK